MSKDSQGQYPIANPVRSTYAKMLEAAGNVMKASSMLSRGLGNYEDMRSCREEFYESLIEMSVRQSMIVGGYFNDDQIKEVYPNATPEGLAVSVMLEAETLEANLLLRILERRKVLIRRVCEEEKWFEKEWGNKVIPLETVEKQEQPPEEKRYAGKIPAGQRLD